MTSASCVVLADPHHRDQVGVAGDRVDLAHAREVGDRLGDLGDPVDLGRDEHDGGDHAAEPTSLSGTGRSRRRSRPGRGGDVAGAQVRRTGRAATRRRRRATTTGRRPRPAARRAASSQRRTQSISSAWARGVGPGPGRTRSRGREQRVDRRPGRHAAGDHGPVPASRPCRTTHDLPAAVALRRPAATSSGSRARAGRRCIRAATAAAPRAGRGARRRPRTAGLRPAGRSAPRAVATTGRTVAVEHRADRPSTCTAYAGADSRPSHGAAAAAHADQRAGRPGAAAAAAAAVHCRSGTASCSAAIAASARAARPERAEVVRAVVAQRAHQGQPRERLDGELEPEHPLREPRAPVVPRLVLGDQAQLAHLGLERGRAGHRPHPLGEPDHLAPCGCASRSR